MSLFRIGHIYAINLTDGDWRHLLYFAEDSFDNKNYENYQQMALKKYLNSNDFINMTS